MLVLVLRACQSPVHIPKVAGSYNQGSLVWSWLPCPINVPFIAVAIAIPNLHHFLSIPIPILPLPCVDIYLLSTPPGPLACVHFPLSRRNLLNLYALLVQAATVWCVVQ